MVKVCFKANTVDEAKEMYIGFVMALDETATKRVRTWCRLVSGIELED
jgi:hypothetical protein